MSRLLIALALITFVALALTPALAQTPPSSGCARAARGGETVSAGYITTLVAVTLPSPGDYTHGPFLNLGPTGVTDAGIQVCHVQTGAWIRLSAITGREASRSATGPDGNTVLDKIAAGTELRLLSEVKPVHTASSPPPDAREGLRYRLQVFGRNPNQLAADGTRVSIRGLPRPPQVPGLPVPKEPCGEGLVAAGYVEIVVWLTDGCPAGLPIGITLFLVDGAITAESEPALEWRAPRPGEKEVIDGVVRPVPPRTGGGGDTSPNAKISPPDTGSAGLLRPRRNE